MTFEVIPAIDLIDGKCVRLSQGDFARKRIYDEDPIGVARTFEEAGLKRLHIVDLEGARTGAIANLRVLESIAAKTSLRIDFGGGIRTREDIEDVLNAGAAMVNIGSIAVKESKTFFEWLDEFGSERIMLGTDVRNGKLAINGWQRETELEILPFLTDYFDRSGRQAFATDISKDGLLQGPSTKLYKEIIHHLPKLSLIASGGISSLQDVIDVRRIGCGGVIVGKAIYEKLIRLQDLVALEEIERVN